MNDFIVVVIIKRNELGFLILRLFPELLIIILKTSVIFLISSSPVYIIFVPFLIFFKEQLLFAPETVIISIPFSSLVLFNNIILLIGANDSYSSIISISICKLFLTLLSIFSLIFIN